MFRHCFLSLHARATSVTARSQFNIQLSARRCCLLRASKFRTRSAAVLLPRHLSFAPLPPSNRRLHFNNQTPRHRIYTEYMICNLDIRTCISNGTNYARLSFGGAGDAVPEYACFRSGARVNVFSVSDPNNKWCSRRWLMRAGNRNLVIAL